jgi:prolyl 4-hydroxylase
VIIRYQINLATALLTGEEKFYHLSKIDVWQNEINTLGIDVMKYITNPLNAFLMIKRGTRDLFFVKDRFPEGLKHYLDEITIGFPDNDDLRGAVEGLLRLQTTYRLKSEDFVEGIIDRLKTRPALSCHDIYTIGLEAFFLDQDYFAQDYLSIALDSLQSGEDPDGEVDFNELLLKLVLSYNRTGSYEQALETLEELIRFNPTKSYYQELRSGIKADLEEFGLSRFSLADPFSDYFEKDGRYEEYKENIVYSRICRGNVTKSLQERSKLVCRYVSNTAFSKLARFKIEELNHEPSIVMFYDVLSDIESDFLKEITKPIASRGLTYTDDLKTTQSRGRIAQLAWHSDYSDPILRRISKRTEVSRLLAMTKVWQ